MQLRFIADRRTLFWVLCLFPALPALSYARPELAPWLLPLSLYLSYCSGVLAHNHNHAPVFRDKRLNSLYSAWLSFFYGCPLFVWIPTHNQNHHRYLDGPGDATRTSELAAEDSLWAALSYPTRSSIAQMPAIVQLRARCMAASPSALQTDRLRNRQRRAWPRRCRGARAVSIRTRARLSALSVRVGHPRGLCVLVDDVYQLFATRGL